MLSMLRQYAPIETGAPFLLPYYRVVVADMPFHLQSTYLRYEFDDELAQAA